MGKFTDMYELTPSQERHCEAIESKRESLKAQWIGGCDRDDKIRLTRMFDELGEELWGYVRSCMEHNNKTI